MSDLGSKIYNQQKEFFLKNPQNLHSNKKNAPNSPKKVFINSNTFSFLPAERRGLCINHMKEDFIMSILDTSLSFCKHEKSFLIFFLGQETRKERQ